MKKCIILSEKDNVATVLLDVSKGEIVSIIDNEFIERGIVTAIEDIPYMHKICLKLILNKEDVVKSDCCIGIANGDINQGALVHVNNTLSLVGTGAVAKEEV